MKLGRLGNLILFGSWLGIVTWLLVMPMPPGADIGISYADKIVHVILFGILVYFLIETIESFYILKYRYVILASFTLTIIYAEIMEIVQGCLAYRTNDPWDTMAGIVGSTIAAGLIIRHDRHASRKPKLLLHTCCIGCGVSLIEKLSIDFDVHLFFYNPNIFPKQELHKRLEEIKKVSRLKKLKIIVSHASHSQWLKKIKGYENEPERGRRCNVCYRDRLAKTAHKAKQLGFQAFSSTLSISPHKNYPIIKQIGTELGHELDLEFLDDDFKKNGGFQKSCEISRELNLYRQDYCGCEFSIRKN